MSAGDPGRCADVFRKHPGTLLQRRPASPLSAVGAGAERGFPLSKLSKVPTRRCCGQHKNKQQGPEEAFLKCVSCGGGAVNPSRKPPFRALWGAHLFAGWHVFETLALLWCLKGSLCIFSTVFHLLKALRSRVEWVVVSLESGGINKTT